MNIVFEDKKKDVKLITMSKMEIGEVGIVSDFKNRSFNGHVVLATYSGIVSLSEPFHTWDDVCALLVRLVPNEDVEIVIKEQ